MSAAIRCLCIDEIVSRTEGTLVASFFRDLPGISPRIFYRREGEALWDQLQIALMNLRASGGRAFLAARGTGCAAALALAEQLPVERLALIEPMLFPSRGSASAPAQRQLRRLSGFARRNLSLCVSDMLVVEREASGRVSRLAAGLSRHCRMTRLILHGGSADNMYIIHEQALKRAVSSFLQCGDLPKSLAENPEMCIIYG